MAVIAPGGIVGRIIGNPAAQASRVQLLIDRNAAAGAFTERTHSGGMVSGVDKDPPLIPAIGGSASLPYIYSRTSASNAQYDILGRTFRAGRSWRRRGPCTASCPC